MEVTLRLLVISWMASTLACVADTNSATEGWTGTMDTLASGQVDVKNTHDPLWKSGEEWQVVEEVRLGKAMGEGPHVFGRVKSFDVDNAGRIWVLDGLALELRVFDSAGAHIRTIGRRGAGPGEFAMPVKVEIAPDRKVWVVDVGNNRISVFDTAGQYLHGRPIPTSFPMTPWPGGFDEHGHYYAPVSARPAADEQVAYTFARLDSALLPLDTLDRPLDPIQRTVFNHRGTVGRVPLQGTMTWHVARDGTVWGLVTDRFRLFQIDWNGDTIRTVTRAFEPLPVTQADRDQVHETWRRYVEQRGQPDWWSNLPATKPPVTGFFFLDAEQNIWVERQPGVGEEERTFAVFDSEGRYLGPVWFPFVLRGRPIARQGWLYGRTQDDMDVPYIVKTKIRKPNLNR